MRVFPALHDEDARLVHGPRGRRHRRPIAWRVRTNPSAAHARSALRCTSSSPSPRGRRDDAGLRARVYDGAKASVVFISADPPRARRPARASSSTRGRHDRHERPRRRRRAAGRRADRPRRPRAARRGRSRRATSTDLALLQRRTRRPDAPGSVARRLPRVERRRRGLRDRQPLRPGADADERDRLGDRPHDPGPRRLADRRRDPDRRRAEPRQLRRPADRLRTADVVGVNSQIASGGEGAGSAASASPIPRRHGRRRCSRSSAPGSGAGSAA